MLLFRFLLAMVPILWLILALSGLKMSSHKACLAALALACLLSISFWSFSPLNMVTAILEGVLNALWPICLVITAALFTYNITVKTGAMNQINVMLAGVSSDQRVMMLLIGWGFGNFMEGMAGFGTSVAIPASMLASMGFHPISAAVACLVGTSMQTPFGSVGIATTTSAAVTGLDSLSLSGDVANLQWILTFMAPYIMICIMGGGIRALKGVMTITTIAASVSPHHTIWQELSWAQSSRELSAPSAPWCVSLLHPACSLRSGQADLMMQKIPARQILNGKTL